MGTQLSLDSSISHMHVHNMIFIPVHITTTLVYSAKWLTQQNQLNDYCMIAWILQGKTKKRFWEFWYLARPIITV